MLIPHKIAVFSQFNDANKRGNIVGSPAPSLFLYCLHAVNSVINQWT